MLQFQKPSDIINFFKDYELQPATQKYLQFHALRYLILWQKIQTILQTTPKLAAADGAKQKLQILDIGPGLFTELLGAAPDQPDPNFEIHSIGLNPGYFELKSKPIFHKYDLNYVYLDPDSSLILIKDLPQFDLILYCEVLEHLYTGPEPSLRFLRQLLKPTGTLVIQTPNATALHHRLLLTFGKNPFPLLRPNLSEPGHFREYTANELQNMLQKSSLKVKQIEFHNYFNYLGNFKNKLYKFATNFFPSRFRDGITILATRE